MLGARGADGAGEVGVRPAAGGREGGRRARGPGFGARARGIDGSGRPGSREESGRRRKWVAGAGRGRRPGRPEVWSVAGGAGGWRARGADGTWRQAAPVLFQACFLPNAN